VRADLGDSAAQGCDFTDEGVVTPLGEVDGEKDTSTRDAGVDVVGHREELRDVG
jgi:hypothetical protein